MEKTIEKSEEQAEIIKMIAFYVPALDIEYCKEAAKEMLNQASRQESMAVLNPNHPQVKNDILRTQGQALKYLCLYVEKLKEVDRLKLELEKATKQRGDISRLFI